jgi:TRAP-type uncharacterized transport system fused permease subunit
MSSKLIAAAIAVAAVLLAVVFVYSPALMLQAGDPMAVELGFYGAVAFATFKALVAIGFLLARLTLAERAVAFIGALCLLGDFRFSDTAGFILTAVVVLWQWRQRLRIAAVAA